NLLTTAHSTPNERAGSLDLPEYRIAAICAQAAATELVRTKALVLVRKRMKRNAYRIEKPTIIGDESPPNKTIDVLISGCGLFSSRQSSGTTESKVPHHKAYSGTAKTSESVGTSTTARAHSMGHLR